MRILFVSPYVPSSVRIRPFAFIRELARLGHQVTLACLVQPAWEEEYLDEICPYIDELHTITPGRIAPALRTLASLPTRTPLSVAYCYSPEFERLVEHLVQKNSYDLLHTEFIRSVPATAHLTGLPKVYDAVDSLALAYRRSLSAANVSTMQRLVALLETFKMPSYEIAALQHYDRVLVSSPVDRDVLGKHSAEHVTVIQNGVELDYFAFQKNHKQPYTIAFLGKMSYYVNVASVLWFYRQVFPIIRAEIPQARFKIVGRSPAKAIQKLAVDPSVEVTGTVADIRPHLRQATIAIGPMTSGSGIQNKLLEAMALGTPCVATSFAAQALGAKPGQEILVADEPQAFAQAVISLLQNPAQAEAIAFQARQYVEREHNWNAIGRQIDSIYHSLAAPQQAIGSHQELFAKAVAS